MKNQLKNTNIVIQKLQSDLVGTIVNYHQQAPVLENVVHSQALHNAVAADI